MLTKDVAGSWLGPVSWFRRKQQLHFVHHRHANCNFAVIDFFWDRLLGTYCRIEPTRQTAGSSAAAPTTAAELRIFLPPNQRLRNPITTMLDAPNPSKIRAPLATAAVQNS